MKTWTVESLCLAIAALVVLMSAALVLAWNAAPPAQALLLSLFAALAVLALAAALRIRFLTATSSARHDRSRALQRRYNHFVNTAHEGIWVVDSAGRGMFANARLAQMFGCGIDELLSRPLLDFLGDNPREALNELLADHDGHVGRTYDLCYRRVDGSVGWAIASGRPASAEAGMAAGTLLLLTDITTRKQAELELAAVKIGLEVRIRTRTAELEHTNEQLRIEVQERQLAERALSESYAHLRQLTAHLETIKEQERKRIALDIHDDLGQNLMALKIDVQMLHARCTALPGLKEEVGRTLETIDASIRAVRSIINELHPSTLELGLPAATEWLLAQFEQRSGIACSLTVSGGEDTIPDERGAALIFRILEESLINIELHAQATQVEVLLAMDEQEVTVTVLDDGAGLYPGKADRRARAMLDRMRERVDVFGGKLAIQPRPGTGSCLTFRIPLGGAADIDHSWHRYNNNDIEIDG
jgi:PAS domain S-box-containing protein